jgi:hypothetical protein
MILTTMMVPSNTDSRATSHRLLLREMGTVIGTLRMCFMCMFELVDVTIHLSICVYMYMEMVRFYSRYEYHVDYTWIHLKACLVFMASSMYIGMIWYLFPVRYNYSYVYVSMCTCMHVYWYHILLHTYIYKSGLSGFYGVKHVVLTRPILRMLFRSWRGYVAMLRTREW